MPFVAQQQEKCTACNRTVYQTEKTVVEELDSKKVYHKACIRCSFERCNKVLSLGEFSSIEGKFYCKPHFKQLFAEKGNYEEGFGLEKKSKGSVVTTPGNFVPLESTKQNIEKRETSEATAAKFRRFREDADSEKCTGCGKTVYVTEKVVVEEKDSKKPYHKTCLKCSHEGCGRQLDLGSYVSQEGTIYCKPHFQQLFKSKGTFESIDSSKDKWKNTPVVTEKLSFVPKEEDNKVQSEKNKTSEATAAKIRLWRQESDNDVCPICTKSVAPVEKLVVEEKNTKKVYHNGCFKCSQCGVKLDLRNYGSHEGSIYCRPHLKSATVTSVKPSSTVSVPSSFVPEVKEERSTQKSETPSHIAEKFKGLGSSEKCRSCGKSVYATEKLIVEELKQQHIYHKQCLKCSKCNIALDASTYGSASGVIYCKVHLKQMALPEQVKSENAYFVSPLRSTTNDYVPQYDSQDSSSSIPPSQEKENDASVQENDSSVQETDTPQTEDTQDSVSETSTTTIVPEASYKPSPSPSPKDSPVSSPAVARRQVESEESNNSDDERRRKREEREKQREEEERRYQEEKEKRDREREERRKRREEEQDSTATEEDDAEKRKREREERRKRREEEAQLELEEQARKTEERRQRLEALKQ